MEAKTQTQKNNARTQSAGTMKAVRIHSFGGPDVLRYEETPRPQPGDHDILVRVRAAGVNPVDWKIREGHMKEGRSLPLTLGWEFSGVVEETGSGATRFKKGDEVYARPSLARDGAYAEYIAVDEKEVALKPKHHDHVHCAAVPLAGLTAWQALFDHGGLQAGQTVLIHAAAGGVGSYAVQFAKWKGARVIGTASSQNRDYVLGFGADEFVDYRSERFEDKARDVDVVLDTIGGETQERSWSVLKKGGILVSVIQPPSEEKAAAHGVRQAIFMAQSKPDQLAQIATLIDERKIKVPIETVLPLAEVRKAHELSQSGHARGKIVLTVD